MATHVTKKTKPALLKRVVQTIREQQLLAPGQHLLVAVSGGPDSIALLSLLASLAPAWRLKLTAIHFNYGLRGSESDGDEAFVASFCQARNISFIVRRPVLAKRSRVSSLQALARIARYEAMKSLTREIGADRIVTGHTANDQAETMLMWMLRGAGLTGVAGMPFIREEIIVRPLLMTTREEVLDYLKQERLSYRQDSSNITTLYRRNRIRQELLPVMARITPSIVRLLERQSDLLRADEQYLEQVVDQLYRSCVSVDAIGTQQFDGQAFAGLPPALQRRLVRRMLRATHSEGRAPGFRVIQDVLRFVLTKSKGRRLSLRGAEVTRDRDRIFVIRRREQKAVDEMSPYALHALPVSMAIDSTVYWPGTEQEIHVQVMTRQAAELLLKRPTRDCALFDADRLSAPLVLRRWQAGDRIHPRGMRGKSKKLQDLFTDMKVNRLERNKIPLLVAPEGVLWVVGRREDERFLVGDSTVRCLVATVKSKSVAAEGEH
ncbi:MAG TPA: tRNA lysidine(34) synthetase TilS [Nitrospira sp.]|nr:tRNA lysidine(34) synthetase TilS [Nitrospira sp.]